MPRSLLVVAFSLSLAACRTEPSEAPARADSAAAVPAPDTTTLAEQVKRDAAFDDLAAEGMPDLDDFDLTLDRMERWALASTYLLRLTESKPSLGAKWREDGADPTSYDAMLARIEAEPEAVRQVERAGLTAREFIAVGVVFLRASGAAQDPAGLLAGQPGATESNVEFIRDHRAQIDEMLLPLARPAASPES